MNSSQIEAEDVQGVPERGPSPSCKDCLKHRVCRFYEAFVIMVEKDKTCPIDPKDLAVICAERMFEQVIEANVIGLAEEAPDPEEGGQ